MRIKFITEDGLIQAKSNFGQIYKEVLVKKNKTICELFNNETLIKDTAIEAEDFELDMSQEDAYLTDLENIRRVYGHLKDSLTISKASDERIWVAYALSEFVDYMRYRWMPKNENNKLEHFFFQGSGKRPLFRHGIARLWWIGYLTYDNTRADPYELTSFVCQKQDIINQILDIGFASNPTITKAVLNTLFEAEKSGITINRDTMRDVSQYVNLLGGIYVLDCLSYEEICDKLQTKFKFK